MGDERRGQRAGDAVQSVRAHRGGVAFQFLQKGVVVEPPHAHAVLQLGKVIVKFRRGQFPLCRQVPLIAGVDHTFSVVFPAAAAVLLQNIQRFGGRIPVIGRQRVQALAVGRDPRRHCSDAAHPGTQRQQVVQRAAQLRAVVDAPAQHQLAVHLDAALRQLLQVGQRFAAPLVGQHPGAQHRVGGVDRDEDGADVHLNDAVDLPVGEVGQRDVVAEQEGQPLIVILEIQALPHTGGQLVDEAEHAMVVAAVLFVPQIGLKVAAERLIPVFFHRQIGLNAVPADRQREPGGGAVKLVVQRVPQGFAVNGDQLHSRRKAQPPGGGVFVHRDDLQCHGAGLLPKHKK